MSEGLIPCGDATKFLVRLGRASRKRGKDMLHAFDDRQGHIYALCLGLFVQPLGIAPKRLSPSGIDIKRRVTGEIVLQRDGLRI